MSQPLLVDITVHAVKLSLSAQVRLNIIWKKKDRRVETRNKVLIPVASGTVTIEQTLTGEEYESELKMHSADLYLQALLEGGAKVVGKIALPLSNMPLSQLKFPIQRCPDPYAFMILSLSSRCHDDQPPTPELPIVIERPLRLAINKRVSLGAWAKSEEHKEWRGSARLGRSVDWGDEMEDLQKEINTLDAENRESKRKLKTASEEFRKKQEEYETRIQDLDYEKSRLSRALERADKELKDVSQLQIDQNKISTDIYQQTITELTKKLQAKEVELALAKQEQERKEDKKEVEMLQSALQEAKRQIDAEREGCQQAWRVNEQLTETVSELTRQIESMNAASSASDQKVATEVAKQVEALTTETSRNLAEMKAHNTHMTESLQEELQRMARDSASIIKARNTEIKELQADLAETVSALEAALTRPSLQIKSELIVEITPESKSKEAPLAMLISQLETAEQQLKDAEIINKGDAAKYTAKCATFERYVSSLEATRKKLEIDNERLKFENSQLKSSGATTQTDEKKREKEMFELELMVKYAQEERYAVEQKFAELKMDTAKNTVAREEVWERARRAEEELRVTCKKYAEMEAQFVKVNEQFGQLLNQHNELELETQTLRSRFRSASPSKISK